MATGGYKEHDVATSSDEDTDMDLSEAVKQKLRALGAYDEVGEESKEWQSTSKSGTTKQLQEDEITSVSKLRAWEEYREVGKDLQERQLTSKSVEPFFKATPAMKEHIIRRLIKKHGIGQQEAQAAAQQNGCDIEKCLSWIEKNKYNFSLIEEKSKEYEYSCGKLSQSKMMEWIVDSLTNNFKNVGLERAKAAVQKKGSNYRSCQQEVRVIQELESVQLAKEYDNALGKLKEKEASEGSAPKKSGKLKEKEASEGSAPKKSGGTTTVEELQNKYGFEPNLAQLAVKLNGSGNVEICVDWAIEHQYDYQLWSMKDKEIDEVNELHKRLHQWLWSYNKIIEAAIEAVVYNKTRPNVHLSESYKECNQWIENYTQNDIIDILHETFILRIGQMLKKLATIELVFQSVSPEFATAAVEATSSTNIFECMEWIERNRGNQSKIKQMSEASKAAHTNFRKMEMVKQLAMHHGISPISAKAAVQYLGETNEECCLNWLKNNGTDDGLVQMLSKQLDIETKISLKKSDLVMSTNENSQIMFISSLSRYLEEIKQVSELYKRLQEFFSTKDVKAAIEAVVYNKTRPDEDLSDFYKECKKWIKNYNQCEVIDILHDTFILRFGQMLKKLASTELVSQSVRPEFATAAVEATSTNILDCKKWIERNRRNQSRIKQMSEASKAGQMLGKTTSIELMSQSRMSVSHDLAKAAVEATSSTNIFDCMKWIKKNRRDQSKVKRMSKASKAAHANFRKMEMVKLLVMNHGISPIAAKAAVQSLGDTDEESCLNWLKKNGTDDGLVQMHSKQLDIETSATLQKANHMISTSEFTFTDRKKVFHRRRISKQRILSDLPTEFPPTKYIRKGKTPKKKGKEKEPNVQEGESIVNKETLHMPDLNVVIIGALAETDESTIPVTPVKATTTDMNAPADKGNEKCNMKALTEEVNKEFSIQSHVNACNIIKIDKMGGKIELFGCVITIPEGALEKETEIQMFLSNNPESFPKDVMPISPILGCRPSIQFNKPVKASMRTWYSTSENQEIPAMIFSREDESTDWKIMQHMTLRDRNIVEFEVNHFSDDVVAIAGDNAGDGKYHLLNDVYIQKDTALIVSVFLCDVKTQNEVSQILAKTNFVQLIPIGKKFTAKVGSEIKINLICEEPQGTEAVCYDDTSFRVTKEILDNLRHEIYFKMRPRPQHPGIIDIVYSLKIDNAEKVLPLTTTWPILEIPVPEAKQTMVYNIAANVISAGNATTSIHNQSSVQMATTSTPVDSSQGSSLMHLE